MVGTSTAVAAWILPVVIQGDLLGEVITPACDAPARSTIAALTRAGESDGQLDPVLISTGDLAGPDPQSRHPIESLSGIEALARVLRTAMFDAAVPGDFDLSLDRIGLAKLTELAGVPWTVANAALSFPSAPERIVERGPLRIGLTAVIDPVLADRVHGAKRVPDLRDAVAAMGESVERLRDRGADVVIALAHVPRDGATKAAIRLAQGLRKKGAYSSPDLFVASSLDQEITVLGLDDHLPPIVSPPRGAGRAMIVRLQIGPGGLELIGTELRTIPPASDPSAALLGQTICAELGAPIPDELHGEVTHDQFTRFVLEIMRRTASAEIALVSARSISPRGFPWRAQPRQLDLARAVRFDDHLVVAEVFGSDLAPILDLAGDPRARMLGVSPGKVAGRSVAPFRRYRVVTTDFVARGGDALLDPADFRFEPADDEPLRDVLGAYLVRRGIDFHGQRSIDGASDSAAISEPVLYDLAARLAASMKSVSLVNADGYASPQLSREPFLGLSVGLTARASADALTQRGGLAARGKFGFAGSSADDLVENEDSIVLEALYFLELAAVSGVEWLPDASASVAVDTELTRPSDRPFHHALVSTGVGPSRTFFDLLSVRTQIGARRELFAHVDAPLDEEAREAGTRISLLSSVELERLPFRPAEPASAGVAFRIDHTYDFAGRARAHTLRAHLETDAAIVPAVALTIALDLDLEDDLSGARSLGVAFDTSVGVEVRGDISRLAY